MTEMTAVSPTSSTGDTQILTNRQLIAEVMETPHRLFPSEESVRTGIIQLTNSFLPGARANIQSPIL